MAKALAGRWCTPGVSGRCSSAAAFIAKSPVSPNHRERFTGFKQRSVPMRRRDLLRSSFGIGLGAGVCAALSALGLPGIARGQGARTLRFVPQADAAILDPMITTGLVNRNHGFLVFDTLYGADDKLQPQPQMVAGHTIENDGRTWVMTL